MRKTVTKMIRLFDAFLDLWVQYVSIDASKFILDLLDLKIRKSNPSTLIILHFRDLKRRVGDREDDHLVVLGAL